MLLFIAVQLSMDGDRGGEMALEIRMPRYCAKCGENRANNRNLGKRGGVISLIGDHSYEKLSLTKLSAVCGLVLIC